MALRRLLPLLLAVGLIASGCGSDGDSTSTGTDTGSGTDTTLTDTTATDTTDTGSTDTTDTSDTTDTFGTTDTDTDTTDTGSSSDGSFTSPDGKYTIDIPSAWTTADVSGAAGGLNAQAWYMNDEADGFRENVNVITEGPTNGMSLDDYMDLSISKAPSMIQNFNVESRDKITLDNGDEAYRLIYTGQPTGVAQADFKFMAIVTVDDDTAYTVTFTAGGDEFDQYSSEAESVMKTLDPS